MYGVADSGVLKMLDLTKNRYSSQWRADNDIRKDVDDLYQKMHQAMGSKDYKKAMELAKKISQAKDPVTGQKIQRPWSGDFYRDVEHIESKLGK